MSCSAGLVQCEGVIAPLGVLEERRCSVSAVSVQCEGEIAPPGVWEDLQCAVKLCCGRQVCW